MNEADRRARTTERERGLQAKQILESPIWEETWTGYDATLLEHMAEPGSSDEVVLEARRALILLRRLKRSFETALQTGELASQQLLQNRDAA